MKGLTRRLLLRRAAVASGAVAILPLLAACAGAAPEPTAAPAKPTEAPKPAAPAPTATAAAKPAAAAGAGDTVKWFVRSNVNENKWQDEYAIPEYKKLQPKTTIEKIVTPGTEFNAKLFAMQAAGDTPNMFGFAAFATLWGRGLAAPIDDYLKSEKEDLSKQHFPGLFDTFKWWGKRWGLPMAPRFGTWLMYNKDLFDQAGVPYPKSDWALKTWNVDIMADMAQKLTKNFGKPDVIFGVNFNPWGPHGLAYLWGGDVYPQEMYDNGIAQTTTLDSDASRQALQFKVDLILKLKCHPSAADNQAISVVGSPFATGRVAMNAEGGWAWGNFSSITAFKWGAVNVPGKTSPKNSENMNIWMMGSAPKARDATWEFMKFCTSKEGETSWVNISGNQPSRPDVLDVWAKKHEGRMTAEELRAGIFENYKHTVESVDHLIIDHGLFDDSYNQESAALWDGKITVDDFAKKLKTSWDGFAKQTYDKYKEFVTNPPK